MEYRTIEHTFEPIYDEGSRVLILGSLPSVKSRENNFYYGHPQNRFWRVLWEIFEGENEAKQAEDKICMRGCPVDAFSIKEKKTFLHAHHIALWDVIARCDIAGSSDSSIKKCCAERHRCDT